MPRVSVILPNYNYARYLNERVRSILNQSFQDFELIYVDDASTDESNRVMEAFVGDKRLKMLLFTENSGTVYKRWNDGAAEAVGDWLWFPNADDSAHPRFLERLLALADSHPTAAIIFTQHAGIDAAGRLCSATFQRAAAPVGHLDVDYFSAGCLEVVQLTYGCFLSSASSLIIRRDAFERVGGFDVRLWGVADWDFYLRVLHRYDIAYSAELLSYYRWHGDNTTAQTKSQILCLAITYCLAAAYERMNGDNRYTKTMRETALRRVKARLFDTFAGGEFTIPSDWRFAADVVYDVAPDRRLKCG